MKSAREGFAPFGDDVWLNCAHQGPLPLVAAQAAESAIGWKKRPYELTAERFAETPALLRQAIGRLIHANDEDITLANSASYGLHLIARGIRWSVGDEVIVMEGDFPSDILPWLLLEARGVTVRRVHPRGYVFEPDELAAVIGRKTRLVCLTWVHSFSGWAIDLEALAAVCKGRGVTFIVNGSQAIGARPLDLRTTSVDAVTSVGFKWLCGPYGTGFCWMRRGLREALEPAKAYWLSTLTASDLAGTPEIKLSDRRDGAALDVFGTANFFNFVPWRASIEYLLAHRIEEIASYDQVLVSYLLERIDREKYRILSLEEGPARSTLVLFSHRDSEKNAALARHLQENRIHVAMRAGAVRVSPHLYNTPADIDRLLDALNRID